MRSVPPLCCGALTEQLLCSCEFVSEEGGQCIPGPDHLPRSPKAPQSIGSPEISDVLFVRPRARAKVEFLTGPFEFTRPVALRSTQIEWLDLRVIDQWRVALEGYGKTVQRQAIRCATIRVQEEFLVLAWNWPARVLPEALEPHLASRSE